MLPVPPEDDDEEELFARRPRTRADCEDGPRPCPWVSCKYHLLVDPKPSGALSVNLGSRGRRTISTRNATWQATNHLVDEAVRRLDTMPSTCALDVADQGPQTLQSIGRIVGLTRERIRLVELEAKVKCKSSK